MQQMLHNGGAPERESLCGWSWQFSSSVGSRAITDGYRSMRFVRPWVNMQQIAFEWWTGSARSPEKMLFQFDEEGVSYAFPMRDMTRE
jgi:hypothetical protein